MFGEKSTTLNNRSRTVTLVVKAHAFDHPLGSQLIRPALSTHCNVMRSQARPLASQLKITRDVMDLNPPVQQQRRVWLGTRLPLLLHGRPELESSTRTERRQCKHHGSSIGSMYRTFLFSSVLGLVGFASRCGSSPTMMGVEVDFDAATQSVFVFLQPNSHCDREDSTEHVTFAQVHTTCRDRRRPAASVSLRCRPGREQPVAPSSVYLCSKGGDIAYGVTSCGSPVRMMLRLPADAGCGEDANGTSDDFSSTAATAGGQAPIAASVGAAVVCANAALCANSTEPRSLGLAWGRAFTVLLRPADAVDEEFASVERMADVASDRPHPADRNTLFHGVVAFLVCVGVALLALLVVWTKRQRSQQRTGPGRKDIAVQEAQFA
ncbi:uncharacterized protein LOC116940659 [Petromyzon marinus]|uniref:uncharacterized protein LOC116940659 n=1 Tax=Petromyzon marinus TaxID=7757 RepID=UPI003F6F829C